MECNIASSAGTRKHPILQDQDKNFIIYHDVYCTTRLALNGRRSEMVKREG